MIWFKSNCWSNVSWIMHFLGWQIKCLKDPCIKNGPIWASSKNLPFFLDVTSKLFQHISGFSDVKYQMTWCIEHEKYPNCVRLCTVVSVIDNLLVTVYRNTLYMGTVLWWWMWWRGTNRRTPSWTWWPTSPTAPPTWAWPASSGARSPPASSTPSSTRSCWSSQLQPVCQRF